MSPRSTVPSITTFEEFRDAVSAYRLPRLLLMALELNLFTVVGERRWTVSQLAKKLAVSERGLAILCRNLAMSGILLKQGEAYRNSRLGMTALNARHAAYRGGVPRTHQKSLEGLVPSGRVVAQRASAGS